MYGIAATKKHIPACLRCILLFVQYWLWHNAPIVPGLDRRYTATGKKHQPGLPVRQDGDFFPPTPDTVKTMDPEWHSSNQGPAVSGNIHISPQAWFPGRIPEH